MAAATQRNSNVRRVGILALTVIMGLVLWGCAMDNGPLILSGNLETYDLDLIAPFAAELIALQATEGNPVAPGDTLAVLDTMGVAAALAAAHAAEREARARLADLEAGTTAERIRAAEARLEIASANLQQSERDLTRTDSLFQAGVLDAQSFERAQLKRDNALSARKTAAEQLADLRRGARTGQISAARAAWERATATVTARQRDYDRAFLISRHRGIIQLLPYQIGELIPAGRAVVTLRDPDALWAMIYVPENRLNEVAIGQAVRFQVDAFNDREFSGTISHIAAAAEFTPRNVQTPDERLNLVFKVKVEVTPGQTGLRAGMPADFTLE